MRVDVHTHVVPERWQDWAARCGGGNWPRLEHRDDCRATIFTGAQFFRDIDDRSWNPTRRLEDMDRLRIDVQALSPHSSVAPHAVAHAPQCVASLVRSTQD